MSVILQPGDIFLTKGHSLVSRCIRVLTRSIGESSTKVNHVGVVVTEGDLKIAFGVEAIKKVTRRTLWEGYGHKKDSVAVYRPTNLPEDDIHTIVKRAEEQVGKKYGHLMIAAHLLDYFLLGAYFFRRLVRGDKYPICSWVVADAYSKAGKHFGVDPGQAQPDDIWDFVDREAKKEKKEDRKYERVRKLVPLAEEPE